MIEAKHVIDFVADIPLSKQLCAFNVMRIKGNHRQCNHYVRETIDRYGFCKRHAQLIRATLALTADSQADNQ